MQSPLSPGRTKSRSLTRRLAPWLLSLGMFATGGWGVLNYQHRGQHPGQPAGQQVSDSDATGGSTGWSAGSATTARAEIEQLFGASQTDVTASRYARPHGAGPIPAPPELPPLTAAQQDLPEQPAAAEARSATSSASVVNPFSVSASSYDDRYASPPPASPTQDASATSPVATDMPSHLVAEAPAVPEAASEMVHKMPPPAAVPTASAIPSDVTRGQEPATVNPLRRGADIEPSPEPSPEARQAFSDDAGPVTVPPRYATSAPVAPPSYQSAPPATESVPETPSGTTADRSIWGIPQESAAATPEPAAPRESGIAEGLVASLPPSPPVTSDAAMLREGTESSALATAPRTPPVVSANSATYGSPAAGSSTYATTGPDELTSPHRGTGRPGERTLEGSQSPSLAVEKLAPAEIQVGRPCTFAVRIRNQGPSAAHGVEVRDEVPQGTELIGTSPRASVSGAQVRWELGTMSAGEERVVEMELRPIDEGELGSVATVVFGSQASAKAVCTRPALNLQLSSSPQVMIGEQQVVQIEISNPGSGDATGVMLLESIPDGVRHEAGPALEFPVGTLRAGESRRLELTLQAQRAGLVNNVMVARADANLEVQASVQFEVIAPDLQVAIDGPQRRYLERPATYTVSIANPGTASAHDVQLVTKLPKGLQFVSANNMGEYDSATHSIYWSLAELPASEQGTVELVALPIESGEHRLEAATRAQQGLEDRTETSVTVEGLAALMFEVVDLQDPIEIGGETSYEIRVMNQGSKAASNVQVVAIMPGGMRAIAAEGGSRHTLQGDRVVFAPLAQLTPKTEVLFRVHAQGTRPGDQRVRVQVTTDEVLQPVTKEESTQVYADQ